MKNYTYQNMLIGKKQLRQLLAWSFTNYDSMQACALADELKYLGFKYASQAGISISIEDLKIPFVKNLMLEKSNKEIINAEKLYLKGKLTDVERFQKIIDTWSLTSESLKEQVIYYFKTYDPLNSVYMMAFSGARGNLSQVRQLVGMRGLMSDPSGEILNLPIKKNFREGLTITDYLMSGYGARKGVVDTALKTANSGYLTRRLIDVGQDILIREKDCFTTHSFLISGTNYKSNIDDVIYDKLIGRVLNKSVFDPETKQLIAQINNPITPKLIKKFKKKKIKELYIRSSLTCNLYRSVCQKCYGWDLSNENLVDIGEAIGILAGQSIGEPGTQLTMRTFHTGGIFTSEARQQIISPINGIIRFYKTLKTVLLRTNQGEDVLITKNSGSILLIPEHPTQKLLRIDILRNTILFPKNNQYILKDTVIGESLNINKQVRTEIKPILSDSCGEIFMPSLKKQTNSLNNNKLIWILSGQLYNSPRNSFINFYPDYKLNSYSSIFRTKIVNHYQGLIEDFKYKQDLYKKLIRVTNIKYSIPNSNLYNLTNESYKKNYLLKLQDSYYLLKINKNNSKLYLQVSRNKQIGIAILDKFRTLTGGTVFYNYQSLLKCNQLNKNILYFDRNKLLNKYKPIGFHRTIVWLGEEIHKVNCEKNTVFVEHGDFISVGFEILPNIFSKTSGIVAIHQKSGRVQMITIKSGLVYEGKQIKNHSKKLYYPGEIILSNIPIEGLLFCEYIVTKTIEQLLFRPIEIYEFPNFNGNKLNVQNQINFNKNSNTNFKNKILYLYKSQQKIKGIKNTNLISNSLTFNSNKFLNKDLNISLLKNKKTNSINLRISKRISFNKYILPKVRYNNTQSCFITQPNQYIDPYTILGYLEAITINPLEIIKFKIKIKDISQIFLISNNECLIIKKDQFPNKKLNDFIINGQNINETGKIIIENENLLTLQKGRPYFFPNCKSKDLMNKTTLQYKITPLTRVLPRLQTNRQICLNFHDIMKISVKKNYKLNNFLRDKTRIKAEFSKLVFKKNGKLYSSLVPQFLKKFSIGNFHKDSKCQRIEQPDNANRFMLAQMDRTLLLQSSEIVKNQYKNSTDSKLQLNLIKFAEYPFTRTTKSLGLYSITEDFFEQDVNSVFCRNNEFIEVGETIGLLNLEKEITGDIVQGLPRIEEILEARKKNLTIKQIPTSQKRGLVVQKTSLDPNFEFRKLGTSIKENEKINPHKLLKVYFNYYGSMKTFICDRIQQIKFKRLIQNYEGSYRSFKKVQLFILNSVQSVYESQGVSINDKHLEVIIKQMTTKVSITYEGNTPLFRQEVIDLYHIQYINQIIYLREKQPAYYVPVLFGITKAALNNPSFISAASFQETTRVLTKAAIEGRIDWLRGLKENIIIGHLIPAGTGSQNYRNCFKKSINFNSIPDLVSTI
uniref:DNA-directed RNA polymerase n=1 Tax=Amicula sp. isolate GU52X-4 cfCalB7 TaxID=3003489 RepID=A0A9E8Z1H1_9STRA|nr:RNA polymerase beta'' subunit [Amicula sp. isolate GU52X-4 cfCalB7]